MSSIQVLQPYEISLVSYDFTSNETLNDVFYSLETLSVTVEDIFNRIDKRLSDEKNRLVKINERVGACQSKVAQVRGSKSAITVFSTAKFPAPKELPSYPTLYDNMHTMPSPYRPIDDEIIYDPAEPRQSVVGNRELSQEVSLLYSRLNAYGSDMERVEFIMEDEGLGSLPPAIHSVGSILLFNSNINPYRDYQTLDNLLASTSREKISEQEKSKQLASAPSTILSGDALPDIAMLDLTFKPEMGTMASLALPSNLPLDFLADLNYSGAALPSIAPTMLGKGSDLPNLQQSMNAGPTAKQPNLPTTVGAVQSSAPPLPPTISHPPPPPGPPPSGSIPPPPPGGSAPPPPPGSPVVTMPPHPPGGNMPPPPIAPKPPAPQDDGSDDGGEDVDDAPIGGGMGGLLDAIKGMSIANLKKKEERKITAAKVQQKEVAKKPTMMEEMIARMQRRNDALSGKKDKEERKRDSIIVQNAIKQPEQGGSKPAPPPDHRKNSALISAGFAPIEANSDDEDALRIPVANIDDDSSISSSGSDISDISLDASVMAAPKPLPVKVVPSKPSIIEPEEEKPVQQQHHHHHHHTKVDSRRGTMLDPENKIISSMMAVAEEEKQKKKKDDSDDSEDDWDDDDDD